MRFNDSNDASPNAKVIYPLFMKRASLHKKWIDYLSIRTFGNSHFDKRKEKKKKVEKFVLCASNDLQSASLQIL